MFQAVVYPSGSHVVRAVVKWFKQLYSGLCSFTRLHALVYWFRQFYSDSDSCIGVKAVFFIVVQAVVYPSGSHVVQAVV